MAFSVHVVHPEDFIRLKADGYVDFPRSRHLLSEVGTMMKAKGIEHAILDFRKSTGQLSATDMYELVQGLADSGIQPSYHLAILHPQGPGERAHFFSLCANNRGWHVGAFATFEEAFEWLNRGEDATA